MYILQHQLKNYRSCINTKIEINKNLTTLIGPNASGKSNIMNGILLLKRMLFDRPSYYLDTNISTATESKIESIFIHESKKIFLKANFKLAFNEKNIDDIIGIKQKWNFREITGRNKWIEIPIDFFKYFERKQIDPFLNPFGGQRELFVRYVNKAMRMDLDKNIIQFINNIIYFFLHSISYYSASQFTDPSKCPVSIELEDEREIRRIRRIIDKDHSVFILNLYRSWKTQKPEYKKYYSLIGPEGMNLIDKIDFKEIDIPSSKYEVVSGGKLTIRENKRKLIIPQFEIDNKILSPNQLSEGTFKTIALLYYVITDNSQLLLIEEPEVSIHHGLLNSVIEIIKNASKNKQIIITTHSDFVLDKMIPENVILIKKEKTKGTIANNLSKSLSKNEYLALKEYLCDTGNLGEYWKEGALEK